MEEALKTQINDIRKLVRYAHIEAALDGLVLLAEKTNDREFRNYTYLNCSNYHQFQKDNLVNLSNDVTQRNKAVMAILNFVDDFEVLYLQKALDNSPKKLESPSLSNDKLARAISEFRDKSNNAKNQLSFQDQYELYALKVQIHNQMFRNFDEKVIDLPENRQQHVSILFNRILFGKNEDKNNEFELEKMDIEAITAIRLNAKNKFTWYERSNIVSALTLRLVNHFNKTTAHLLIDFLTHFEDKVWQRALVGIVLGLMRVDSKLSLKLMEDLTKRLHELQDLPLVQNGLCTIDLSLQMTGSFVVPELGFMFEEMAYMDYFKEPQHWFMPFYDNNPVLQNTLLSSIHPIDDEFAAYFVHSPLTVSSLKYWIFLKLDILTSDVFEAYKKLMLNFDQSVLYELKATIGFEKEDMAFLSAIGDFFYFFKYAPQKEFSNAFEKELKLHDSKLLSIVGKDAENRIIQANTQLIKGETGKAIDNLKEYLKEKPENTAILFRLGKIYQGQEDFQNAMLCFQNVYNLQQNDILNKLSLAYCFQQLGEYNKALHHYLEAETLIPNDISNLELIGDCYFSAKDFENALKYYKNVEKDLPDSAILCLKIGNTFLESGQTENALSYFLKAQDIDKTVALYEIGTCYSNFSQYEKALPYYLKVNEKDPKNALYEIGYCYSLMEKHAEAVPFHLKYNQIDPDFIWNNYYIGWSGFVAGDIQSAEKGFLKTIELIKDESETRYTVLMNLGHIALTKKDKNRALDLYRQSIVLWEKQAFLKGFDDDFQYIKQYGVTEEVYLKVKSEI
jgi:tetratricopeptide (TPR) repeat protein